MRRDEAAASALRFALSAWPAGGGIVEDGRIRWRYFQRYRWKYRQRKTLAQGLCRGRRPRPSAAAPQGRPGRGRRSRAAGSARRGARRGAWASDPRPLKMRGGKAVFAQEAAIPSLPPAAAGPRTAGRDEKVEEAAFSTGSASPPRRAARRERRGCGGPPGGSAAAAEGRPAGAPRLVKTGSVPTGVAARLTSAHRRCGAPHVSPPAAAHLRRSRSVPQRAAGWRPGPR